MNPKTESRLKGARFVSGMVSIGLATFIALLVLMPSVQTATITTFPIPPYDELLTPNPDPCVGPLSLPPYPCVPPPPIDPYCLFPGEGKHMGFGNGFGRAGARFLCEVARVVGLF